MIQFWLPFFWSLCWSLRQASWPFFIVLILHVDCPFSELTSVPVCPTLILLSEDRFSTGNDCQGLTFLPSCPGLFRLDVGSTTSGLHSPHPRGTSLGK